MTSALEINGKTLHPIREVAQTVSYSRDYITRLAREEKIVASNIGRQWYVDLDSLRHYIDSVGIEQEIRKKQLSAERKRERQLREAVEKRHTLRLKKAETLHVRAAVAAFLVLGSGLMGGLTIHQLVLSEKTPGSQMANTHNTQVPLPSAENSVVALEEEKILNENGDITVPRLTQELRPIGDVQNGILLLPSDGSTTTVAGMFSDTVLVRELPDGTEVVVRVDAEGNTIGNEIPFVTVPVKREGIEI